MIIYEIKTTTTRADGGEPKGRACFDARATRNPPGRPDKTAEPRYQQAEGDDGDAGTTSKGQADDDLQDSIRMTTFTKSPYEGRNSQIDNDLVPEHLKE